MMSDMKMNKIAENALDVAVDVVDRFSGSTFDNTNDANDWLVKQIQLAAMTVAEEVRISYEELDQRNNRVMEANFNLVNETEAQKAEIIRLNDLIIHKTRKAAQIELDHALELTEVNEALDKAYKATHKFNGVSEQPGKS